MIKKLIVVLIVLFTFSSNAQEGTASPYSFYGIGSLKFKGTVENRSMGGLSIYMDSIHLNLRNPASYAGKNLAVFGGESRPVKFTVGGSTSSIKLKTDASEDKTSTTTFDYLAIGIPVGKFGVGIGLLPFTSVGYKLERTNNLGVATNRYNGTGGLNKAFLSVGYQITDNLSFGIDTNYNFGNIQNNVIAFVYDDEGELVQYQTQEENRSDLSGLNFNFGLNYKTKLKDKLYLTSALTFAPKSDITSDNSRDISTIIINQTTGQTANVNTISSDLTSLNLNETDLVLPSRFSLGAGLGKERNWFFGAEYTSLKTSEFSNRIFSIENTTFEDASTFSLGGFYIPEYNSLTSYWKRVVYRGGIY